jgi:acyl transferase domain-containing protein/acyl-CoA synthetase (AMP-forming)/AMP-acid ligase II/acyl carrier protein
MASQKSDHLAVHAAPCAESFSDLVQLLLHREAHEPKAVAYRFLESGETESAHLTNAELAGRARTVAAHLQKIAAPGARALLLFPPGIDFMPAFFGSLLAGVVAVPCYPPRRNRADMRLAAVAADARASVILTCSKTLAEMDAGPSPSVEFSGLPRLATDTLDPAAATGFHPPAIGPETLAFLQYTSGSTSTPKGVMVSHGNLLHNLDDLDRGWEHTSDSVMVTWLPIFHDMGLIYGALLPLFRGFPCVMMPPAAFIQRPARWLEAITRYRGTHSAAPNFAYDLCITATTPEQRAALDLRSWRMTLNAAEPVREETMARFIEAFAVSGFAPKAMCPGYGLAEGTLKLTATPIEAAKTICWADGAALANNRIAATAPHAPGAYPIVGCGRSLAGTRIVIVDPAQRVACPPGAVGEIWAAGLSIAQGYWGRPEQTAETFHACLADTGEGPFLRTGDLGFLREGECFVTGRLKDILIIRGQNYYPQDIELIVERSHPALRAGFTAAFPIEVHGEERLVVAQEIERTALRKFDAGEVASAILQAIAEKHEILPEAILLLKPGNIPKTSSGKIQRQTCKARFLEGSFEIVGEWRQPRPEPAASDGSASAARGAGEIREWLAGQLSRQLRVPVSAIDPSAPFSRHGLDSVGSVQLVAALGCWLGRELPAELAYDHPSIDALAAHLGGEEARASTAGAGRADAEPIAIVGLACRFPGAENPQAYWDLLRAGGDAVREMAFPRFEAAGATPGLPPEGVRFRGGYLEEVDRFDAHFFGIAPREAELMDPQQRLLLEVAWEALEDAGIPADSLAGSQTGVFAGLSTNDYQRLQAGGGTAVDPYAGTGNALSIAANRLSYVLDLRGPSWAVDTACSSSLVAVHQACQSLRAGECDLALAGGVNLILSPELGLVFTGAHMLSPSGRCHAFEAGADGFVRSEGCGVVVLRPLSQALSRGERILALIRGSAVNQDGRSHGLTAPNGPAQQAVIRQALSRAGISATEVGFVEAHGTGTALGDPIEIGALRAVLAEAKGSTPEQPCVIGSVKANIGHLEAAAGIAGLVKTVLALDAGEIPGQPGLQELNPQIDLAGGALQIAKASRLWPLGAGRGRRIAGVSSFGFGGTNAHVILEEAPPLAERAPARQEPPRWQLLALSARSAPALAALARAYRALLEGLLKEWSGTEAEAAMLLAHLCRRANAGRCHFREQRLAVVGDSLRAMHDQLAAILRHVEAPSSNRALFPDSSGESPAPDPQRQQLDRLAAAYASGDAQPPPGFGDTWQTALGGDAPFAFPRRITLPTYPFQRQRHWFQPARQGESKAQENGRAHDLFYELAWHRCAQREQRIPSGALGVWLILADEAEASAGRRLAALLPDGSACQLLLASEAHRLEETVDAALAIATASAAPLRIVHLWGLEKAGAPSLNGADANLLFAESRRLGLESTLRLLRTLKERAGGEPMQARLWLVTRDAVEVEAPAGASLGPDAPTGGLLQTPSWGLGRVIALETPDLWGGLIDLPAHPHPDEAEALFSELCKQPDGEEQIALRTRSHPEGHGSPAALDRWAARLRRFSASGDVAGAPVQADGVYLVTGGLGALGLEAARWLARSGARHLLLNGRNASPDRLDFRQREMLDDLAKQGVRVQLLQADVADAEAMEQALSAALRGAGSLRGVIHAAGLAGFEPLEAISADALHAVLRPKVEGAWVLHRLCARHAPSLDFFVCFSSIAALWGSKGQGHYSAANAFLDGLCRWRRRLGLPALSINFGPWELKEAAGGMATSEARRYLAHSGIAALQAAQALGALGALLRQPGTAPAQCAIARVDWSRLGDLFAWSRARGGRPPGGGLLEGLLPGPQPPTGTAPEPSPLLVTLREAPPGSRLTLLQNHLQSEAAAVLRFEQPEALPLRTGFFDLGMDSLMALQFKDRVQQHFPGLRLNPTLAFDFPNLEKLAAFLEGAAFGQAAPDAGKSPETPAAISPAEAEEFIMARLSRLSDLLKH